MMNDSYHGHKCGSSPSGVCGSSKMGHICNSMCNSHWIIVYLVADVYDCITSAGLRLEYKRINSVDSKLLAQVKPLAA